MKSLVIALALFATSQVFAGTVEMGKYRAVDKDTKTIVAAFELKTDASVKLSITTPDVSVNCLGKYSVKIDCI